MEASGYVRYCCCSSAKLFPHEETSAIKLGAVVEMLHTATLVHDDIIDEAKTRRGRPAANTKWGNSKCVLAGDWLYMQAFKIAVQERNFRVLDVLIDLTQQMVEGELLQMEKLGKIISLEEHFDLIFRKTACLFSVSTRLGALIGNATEEQESRPGRIWTQPRPGVSDCGRCAGSDRVRRSAGQAGGQRSARRQGHDGGDPCAAALHAAERKLVETVLEERAFVSVKHEQISGNAESLWVHPVCV